MTTTPRKVRSLAETIEPVPVAEEPSPAPAPPAPISQRPVNLVFCVSDDDRQRLKQIALTRKISFQKLAHEAWNAYLESQGLPPLEPMTANVPSGTHGRR